jgi:putative DNA primase/helicase
MEPTNPNVGGAANAPDRPLLQANDILLDMQRKAVLNAIRVECEKNLKSPPVAVYGDTLRRPDVGDEGLQLIAHDVYSLRNLLSNVAEWKWVKENGASRPTSPPMDICHDLFSPGWAGVPVVKSVVNHPVVVNGALLADVGLDAASGVWVTGCKIDPPAPGVTPAQVAEAVALLKYVFEEFPFVSAADKANYFGFLFTAILRTVIDGVVPMHFFDAPTPGTGKSLLPELGWLLLVGRKAVFYTPSIHETEREKALPALAQGRELLFLDNVDGHFDSKTLEGMLTSPVIEYRPLGRSALQHFPNQVMIAMTGNNIVFKKPLYRRVVFIQQDAGVENPELRTFRIKDIRAWVTEHRVELVGALLTIVQGWLDAGSPLSETHVMGSFESWAATIGGIMNTIGMGADFLGNRDTLVAEKVDDDEPIKEFVKTWAEKYKGERVTAKQLFKLAATAPKVPYGADFEEKQDAKEYLGLLSSMISGSNENGLRKSFGQLLTRYSKRVYAGWKICKLPASNSENWWQLMEVKPGEFVVLPGDDGSNT